MKNRIVRNFNNLSEGKQREFLVKLHRQGEKYGIFPLSHLQKSLLFSYLTKKTDTSYHIRFLIHFSKELDIKLLEKSIRRLLHNNTSLRTKLLVLGDEHFQIVEPDEDVPLHVQGCGTAEEVYEDLQRSSAGNFDLEHEIPVAFRLYRTESDGDYLLSVCIHHMFGDGWSVELFARELKNNYDALIQGGSEENGRPKREYYKCHQVDESTDCLGFWERYLNGGGVRLNFPGGLSLEDHTQAVKKTYVKSLAEKETLDWTAKSYSVSPYCLALGIYLAALHQWCGQRKVCIGIATLNRHNQEEFESIGLYTNTLPVTHIHDEDVSVEEFYQKLKKDLNSILDYSGVPADYVIKGLGFENRADDPAIYQTVFLSSEKIRGKEKIGEGWMYLENIDNSDRIQFDLICCLEKEQGAYSIRFDYRDLLFRDSDIEEFAERYIKIFSAVQEHRRTPIKLKPEKQQPAMDTSEHAAIIRESAGRMSTEYDTTVREICTVWESLLGTGDFSVDDNFFNVGGNSMFCIKMVSRLNAVLETKVKVTDIFKYYTIDKLAEFISTPKNQKK